MKYNKLDTFVGEPQGNTFGREILIKRHGLREGLDMPLIEALAMFLTTIVHRPDNMTT